MSTGPGQDWHLLGTEELKHGWKGLLGEGTALLVLGLIALAWSLVTTLVSVEIFGWLLVVGGALSLGHALVQEGWGSFFMELFAGILYIVAGLMVVANPAAGAAVLTLLIAMFLLIAGVFRIVGSVAIRFQHWPWMLLNGIITLLLGIMIWRQWPWSGLWVIGLFIGIELVFYGWSLMMLALAIRKLPEPRAG